MKLETMERERRISGGMSVSELERVLSVDDLLGTMSKMGRSPSEDEFQRFLTNHGFDGDDLAESLNSSLSSGNLKGAESGNGPPGFPRVASLDFWRDLVLKGSASFGQIPDTGDADVKGGVRKVEAEHMLESSNIKPPPAPRSVSEHSEGDELLEDTMGKMGKGGRVGHGMGKATAKALDEALKDENGQPKTLTKEELRRVRRMISNRESARRSRRHKLEHVQCLDSQIAALQTENQQLMARLQAMELRCRSTMQENAALKSDVEAFKTQLRLVNVTGSKLNRSASMQRVASQEHLAKRSCGAGQQGPYMPADPSSMPGFAYHGNSQAMAHPVMGGVQEVPLMPYPTQPTAVPIQPHHS